MEYWYFWNNNVALHIGKHLLLFWWLPRPSAFNVSTALCSNNQHTSRSCSTSCWIILVGSVVQKSDWKVILCFKYRVWKHIGRIHSNTSCLPWERRLYMHLCFLVYILTYCMPFATQRFVKLLIWKWGVCHFQNTFSRAFRWEWPPLYIKKRERPLIWNPLATVGKKCHFHTIVEDELLK